MEHLSENKKGSHYFVSPEDSIPETLFQPGNCLVVIAQSCICNGDNHFIVSHYDYDFNELITQDGKLLCSDAVNRYEKSNDTFPFHHKGVDRLDRENTVNILGIFGFSALRATRQQQFQRYIDLNAQLLQGFTKRISPAVNFYAVTHFFAHRGVIGIPVLILTTI